MQMIGVPFLATRWFTFILQQRVYFTLKSEEFDFPIAHEVMHCVYDPWNVEKVEIPDLEYGN